MPKPGMPAGSNGLSDDAAGRRLPARANTSDNQVAPEDRYGLEREAPTARRKAGWAVRLRRQGRTIARVFKDDIHGSPDAALAQALSYRDAVLAALPPRTNHEQATKLRRTNKSGISGVDRVDLLRGAFWQAKLTTGDGVRTARFSVADHGETHAKGLAVAQRRRWLEELPATFLTTNAHADAIARANDGDRLERDVDVTPQETLSEAEIERRLATVNGRFDTLRPKRLKVRVKRYLEKDFAVGISDAGRPARRWLGHVYAGSRPLVAVLAKVRIVIENKVAELYGEDAARWFMQAHGDSLLSPDRFDPDAGFNICIRLPSAGSTPS